MAENHTPATSDVVISEEALKKAEEFIEEEKGKSHKFGGWRGAGLTAIAVVMSLFHLYAAYSIVPTYVLRPVHVGFTLFLSFLLFPMLPRFRHRIKWWDVAGALLGVAAIAYMLYWGDEFGDRATSPLMWDQILGVALML
ncbi:MAG: C4-dicarboxylate ABC transporter permease, partial [Thermodesulfobacteriota bacterium]